MSKWVFYPFDYEMYLGEQMNNRRYYRGMIIPPFWRLDRNYSTVKFTNFIDISESEDVTVESMGEFAFRVDGTYTFPNDDGTFTIPSGKHQILLDVHNKNALPAVKISGNYLNTDEKFQTDCGDGKFVNCDFSEKKPCGIEFSLEEIKPKKLDEFIYDFGKETFGYIRLYDVKGKGKIKLFYGESLEEANSEEFCEKIDVLEFSSNTEIYTHEKSTALRFVKVKTYGELTFSQISLMYEYLPLNYLGDFNSSDEKLNEIYKISLYTLHLCTREFFIDGIKRDRWVWGGDSYQSYLMNYYSFFDEEVCKRTMIFSAGKTPFTRHINSILDYTLYWFISLYDYYFYTGDIKFIEKIYQKAVEIMDFCLSRRDEQGYMNSRSDDWVFIDWADMDKSGVVCCEQVLFLKSLEIMSEFSELLKKEGGADYRELFKKLKFQIFFDFWDGNGGLRHCDHEHKPTKYANIFAIMYKYLTDEKSDFVAKSSLKNPNVMPITTPYARFYELSALCECKDYKYVLNEIKDYWGAMCDLGATTFWEEYNPNLAGADHYKMYGRPFGKSLCHAWGASPLYLLGKYFLGVKPIKPGYEEYEINLQKADLKFITGKVPTPKGIVEIYYSDDLIRIKGINSKGTLNFESKKTPKNCKKIAENKYSYALKNNEQVEIIFDN